MATRKETSTKEFRTGVHSAGSALFFKAISLLSGLVVARSIGPGSYGLFVLCRDLCQTLAILARSGFELGIIRKVRENEKEPRVQVSYVVHTLLISGGVAFIFLIMIWAGGGHFLAENFYPHTNFRIVFNLMAVLVPLMVLLQVYAGIYRAYFYIHKLLFATMFLQPFSRLALILIFFYIINVDIWSVVWGTIISFVLALGYLVFDSRKFQWSKIFSISQLPKIQIGQFWSYSFFIALTSSVSLLLTKMDSFMIGYFKGTEDIGKYAIVQLTVPIITLFNGSFNNLLGPTIAQLAANGDHEGICAAMHQHMRWMVISSFPLFLVIVFLGQDLMAIFGRAYNPGWATIFFLAGGQLVVALVSSAGFLLSMTKFFRQELPVLFAALCINVVLNYLWIPEFGITGAAGATFVALCIANILRVFVVSRIYKFLPFDRWCVPPLLLATVAMACTIFFRSILQDTSIWGAYLSSFFFFTCYVFFLSKLGLTPADRNIFNKMIMRAKGVLK